MKKLFLMICAFVFPVFCLAETINPNQVLQKAVRVGNVHDAERAIHDGATNVDELLKLEVVKYKLNYNIIKILGENSLAGLSSQQMDDLYLRAFKDVCIRGDKTKDDFKKIVSVQPWNWVASDFFMRELIDEVGLHDDLEIYLCVFELVAVNKLAGADFVKVATEEAEKYELKNLKQFIEQLNSEIQKLAK